MGLRLGEGLNLEVGDIDASRMRVHIRNAKGNKDRLVSLPLKTLRGIATILGFASNPRGLSSLIGLGV
jgi:integrase